MSESKVTVEQRIGSIVELLAPGTALSWVSLAAYI